MADERNAQGGRMPAATRSAKPLLVKEEPHFPGQVPWKITCKNPEFESIVFKRRFREGVTYTYDEAAARIFVAEFGYECEPPVTFPVPTHRARRRKQTIEILERRGERDDDRGDDEERELRRPVRVGRSGGILGLGVEDPSAT